MIIPPTLAFQVIISASSNHTLPSNWKIDDEEPVMLIFPIALL